MDAEWMFVLLWAMPVATLMLLWSYKHRRNAMNARYMVIVNRGSNVLALPAYGAADVEELMAIYPSAAVYELKE